MRSLRTEQSTYPTTSKSWTDDLPVCKLSGVGFATNQIYREDGNRQEEHPFEDRSYHYKFDEDAYIYGVFDGHEGPKAVDFCYQRMAAEILFGQLNEKRNDEEIKDVLRQSFLSVEVGYMESINDLLAERTGLFCDIPEGLNSYEIYQKVPLVVEKIKRINYELSSGTAAAVVLIFKNKLYVANVGNCRVLLCQTDANSVLKVVQLSVDHDLKNEDELLRLSQLGISIQSLRKCSHLGNQENTRCLGNHSVKGDYKEHEDLKMAMQEPIMAEPDIHGGITIDDSCRFLLLMTAELYKSIEEATGTDQVNKYIAQWVVEQFREQATLTGVAQAVVDKAVRLHHDWYMQNAALSSNCSVKREDITLVLRNFNFPLPNAIKSPSVSSGTLPSTANSLATVTDSTMRTNDTASSSEYVRTQTDSGVGPDQKIEAYVDFSEYFRNVEVAKRNGSLPDGVEF